eukprot:TRINITY_DN22585_c0_g1_i1.p1 TRINITY_DN22585_c0_g1~~TRINITY_DN22585_c0_g1_i1.p1  ORF type:complete len:461 (-),score=55.14 TRINITY_DN22585_c0_g1_i1:91-1347(-)
MNTNVVRVVTGPKRFTLQDHETVTRDPSPMILIPPRYYGLISNPVVREEDGTLVRDKNGQVKLRHADAEIRFAQEPFPLYPGEKLKSVVPMKIIDEHQALRGRSLRDFFDTCPPVIGEGSSSYAGKQRTAGDEWLIYGPRTYIPQVEVQITDIVTAVIVKPDEALELRAERECVDIDGVHRPAGALWLMRRPGAYIPKVNETIVSTVSSQVILQDSALKLRAKIDLTDFFGKERKAGEEWLVTRDDNVSTYIPDAGSIVLGNVKLTVLGTTDYCIIQNPVENGEPQLGSKKLIKGPATFFLRPGESLHESKISKKRILPRVSGLELVAKEAFDDNESVLGRTIKRKPGQKWCVYGPREYVPPFQADISRSLQGLDFFGAGIIVIFNPFVLLILFLSILGVVGYVFFLILVSAFSWVFG